MITHIKTCIQMCVKSVKEWALPVLCIIFLLACLIGPVYLCKFAYKRNKALYDHIMSIETKVNDNTMTIPDGSQVYIVQPQGEQEVIVIGDPDDITVKPKKRTNK